MARSSETGNAVNLGKFASTVSIVESLGDSFDPAHEIIKKDALQSFYQECQDAHKKATDTQVAYDRAVNTRKALFQPLKKIGTRILNAYIAAGAPTADVEDLRGVNRKLQGDNVRAAKDPGSDEEGKRAYSAAQQGFVNLVDHLSVMTARCAGLPGYAPADADIEVSALQQLAQQLKTANTAVDTAAHAWRTAREERSRLFYDEDRGMVARSQLLRSYFKSKKEGGDPLKGIQFRTFRK